VQGDPVEGAPVQGAPVQGDPVEGAPVEGGPRRWLRLAGALALGGLGGALAASAQLPLAWMIGAMLATTAGAMAGLPIAVPPALRSLFVVVLGVMLGSSFTPAILDQLGDWAVSLTALIAYVVMSGAAGTFFFRRFVGYDRVTAYFAAMPGGLSEMVLVGTAMGGDTRIISMTHAARLLLIVLALPFAFQWLLDYDPAARPAFGAAMGELAPGDLALLALCGVAGFFGARALKLPAAPVVGPMILSAIVHLAGWTSAPPPAVLVTAAQVVVGAAIGCRFAGVGLGFILRIVTAAAGVTLVLIAITLLVAGVIHAATGLPAEALVLAFAPGGLAEMSLIALALSMDAAFVATHHIVRIFLVVVLAPLVFRVSRRRAPAGGD
jgi:membrane AbrB-like protein